VPISGTFDLLKLDANHRNVPNGNPRAAVIAADERPRLVFWVKGRDLTRDEVDR
jgi:hypothetical protein